MGKNKETRIEELEKKTGTGVEEEVMVMHWDGDDCVTFCLPVSMRGVRMPVDEYRKKYAGAQEILVTYEDVEEIV